jgi:hypothetical protein
MKLGKNTGAIDMLNIWVHSANPKSQSFSPREIIRVIYLIILTSCFVLDLSKQAATANLVPEKITSDTISTQIETQTAGEKACLLDLKNKSINGLLPVRIFTRLPSVPDNSCGLEASKSEAKIPSLESIGLKIPLSIVPTSSTDRTQSLLANPKQKIDPRYLIAPRSIDLRRLNPTLTQFVINDVPVTHRTQFEVTGGTDVGERSTTNPGLNATALNSPEASESVSNNRVYRFDYRSNYGQLRTIRQERQIVTTIDAPETIFGSRQQISFIGDCLNGSVSSTGAKQICTYTPGLKTDESSIDPKTLIPSRIPTTSRFGDVVTPESQLAIKQPGFQSGANGQILGIDLYFPRIGVQSGNAQGTSSTYDRFESTTTVPTASVGRIHQVILANGKETAIGRTVRGASYIFNDRNTGWMAGIQAATELLPDVEPSLPPGKKGGSTEVDRSLILAANNNRVPDNSLTAYYSGIGSGFTPADSRASTANYRGIWVGFSPVVDRQVSTSGASFQITSPQRISLFSGGEGGVETGTSVTSLVNQNSFGSTVISNAYVQTYLTRYEQDVTTRNSTTIRERTDYQPHWSASGNITNQDSVFRYYSGVIFNPTPNSGSTNNNKAYVGIDYTKVEAKGFSYNLAAIGYANPDPDYYSKLSLNVNKQIPLGKNPAYSLGISGSINYVLDGAKVFDAVNFRSATSFMNIGARANLADISVGATYYVATNLPNSIGNLLSTSASWKLSSGFALSGFYTPTNDNPFRSPVGISASIRLGSNPDSPTLALGWNRNEVDLGVDSNNNRAGVSENVFTAYLRFDAPLNSFR